MSGCTLWQHTWTRTRIKCMVTTLMWDLEQLPSPVITGGRSAASIAFNCVHHHHVKGTCTFGNPCAKGGFARSAPASVPSFRYNTCATLCAHAMLHGRARKVRVKALKAAKDEPVTPTVPPKVHVCCVLPLNLCPRGTPLTLHHHMLYLAAWLRVDGHAGATGRSRS